MNHLGMTQDTNKCALITASSKGLGKAIAKEFAFNGYDIILNGRDETKVYDTQFDDIKEQFKAVICGKKLIDIEGE